MTFVFFSRKLPRMKRKEHVQCTPLKINGWNIIMEVDGSDHFPLKKWVIFVGEPAVNLGFCGYFEGVGALFGLA